MTGILLSIVVVTWIVCAFYFDMAPEFRRMKEIRRAQIERDYLETVAMIGGHVDG